MLRRRFRPAATCQEQTKDFVGKCCLAFRSFTSPPLASASTPSLVSSRRRNDVNVQANDDLRQEQFVSQLVGVFDKIFSSANLGARLRPYEIMATSPRAGLIEVMKVDGGVSSSVESRDGGGCGKHLPNASK